MGDYRICFLTWNVAQGCQLQVLGLDSDPSMKYINATSDNYRLSLALTLTAAKSLYLSLYTSLTSCSAVVIQPGGHSASWK